MNEVMIQVLVFGVASLGITFVLFKWLDSWAEKNKKTVNGTIKYGGGLLGFVIVTSTLTMVYNMIVPSETNVDISGRWSMVLTRNDGKKVSGEASIHQRLGKKYFSITGRVRTEKKPGFVSFQSISGTITNKMVVFVYVNSRSEQGVARGILLSDNPIDFTLNYFDSHESDKNNDRKGLITFTRK